MGSALTPQQIDFFQTNGYLFPFRAVSPAEAAALRGRIEAYEAEAGEEVNKRLKIKAHLAFPWMCELARHPAIVTIVQSLLGPTCCFSDHRPLPRMRATYASSPGIRIQPIMASNPTTSSRPG